MSTANIADPDQRAPTGALCSNSTLLHLTDNSVSHMQWVRIVVKNLYMTGHTLIYGYTIALINLEKG